MYSIEKEGQDLGQQRAIESDKTVEFVTGSRGSLIL